MASRSPHVVLQWSRLGPYHRARIRATHRLVVERGGRLTALETAGDDVVYGWASADEEAFAHEQVFPEATFEALAPRAIVRGVTAALDRLAPDAVVINSYSAPDAQAALLWCRKNRRPAVCLMESKADDAERTPLRERIKSQIVGQFDAALAGGTPQMAYLRQLRFPSDAVFLTCDAVDNAFFREGAETARVRAEDVQDLPGLSDPTPFFLASNRFVARKNLPRLLRAYGAYRDRSEAPWRLVMLGDGPERAALESIAEEGGIDGVTFAGFRPIEELPAYYGLASAFVHAALVEQWGLVVNEALAAGLPVVVSERVGSATDLVLDGETGFRFDPADIGALADRLVEVASMAPEARAAMGRRGQKVVEGWSPEQFARGLWEAVEAGATRADRGPSPAFRAILAAMWGLSRRVGSYYAIPE